MKKLGWYKKTVPSVTFEVQGGNCEKLLTECMRDFIPLSQVQATAFGFFGVVPAYRYRQLCNLATKDGCRIRISQKHGIWFRLYKFKRYVGIPIGLLAAVLLRLLLPQQIWSIEYYGVAADQQQALSDRLFSCGVYQGCFVTDELLRSAGQQIMLHTDVYADLSLNYGKGRLVVEARPATPDPTMYLPQDWDITALYDGVVRSVEVYSGTAAVEPGQMVQKGDVLVKSTWQDQQNQLQPSPCRARIMAYVEKTLSAACPMVQTVETVQETYTDSLALCVGPWKLWLKKGDDPQAVPSQQGVHFLGMALPCTVYRTVSTQLQPQTRRYTREQAQQQCQQTLNALLYQQLPEVQVLSREYAFEEWQGTVYCTLRLRAYADIASSVIEK